MKHVLKGWLVDNVVTTDNKEDKILALDSRGSLTLDDIISEMKKEDTGLRTETLEHSLKLFNRVVSDLLLEGYSVNTGLFRATAQFRGVIDNGLWNPEKNSIYVLFTQDKVLREAIGQTSVNILAEKGDAMRIISITDLATGAVDGTVTAGRNCSVVGRLIKVAGTHESVGVTLTNAEGAVTKLPADMVARNQPSELMLLIPADTAAGTYTLTITTQHCGGGTLLKEPRSVSREIVVNG